MPLPLAYDDAVLGFAGARRRSKKSYLEERGPYGPPSVWLKPTEDFEVTSGLPSLLRTHLKIGSKKMTLYEYFSTREEEVIPKFLHKKIRGIMESFGFSKDTISHFLRLSGRKLKRIDSLWLAVQDNLISGLPELFLYQPEEVIHLYRWIVSNAVYNVDYAGSLFKKLAKWLVAKGARGEFDIELPDPQVGTIWFGPKGFSCNIPFIRSIVENGVRTKDEASRLAMLTSTRGLPCPSEEAQLASARRHRDVLSVKEDISAERLTYVRHLAVVIGRRLKRNAYRGFALEDDPGHLSISSSASFGYSRRDGGKAEEVRVELTHWIKQVPTEDREYSVATGHLVREKAGVPKWETIRIPGVREPAEPKGSEWLAPFQSVETPFPAYVGLNKHTGLMIMACATQAGISRGVLTPDLQLGPNVPYAEVAIVPEPGFKSRAVTKTEWWLTSLLQPYAHWMLSEMKAHPSATHGLGGAHQGFEWAKSACWKKWDPSYEEFLLLSSDLTQATDYCSYELGRELMEGLLEGLGINSSYFQLCVELQTCPRFIISPLIGEGYLTSRGILMGDPGTKVILTMFNLAAEQEAIDSFFERSIPPTIPWRNFACAGDDHIAFGPRGYLKAISQAHRDNRMAVSEAENYRSPTLSRYCEQFIYMDETVKPYLGKAMAKSSYDEHCYVDALKVRLLSREVKGQESRDEKNPAIGKGSQFASYAEWSPCGFRDHMINGVAKYFHARMFTLLRGVEQLRFLPAQLGGLGHCPDPDNFDWLSILSCLSSEHISAICYLWEKGSHIDEVLSALRIPSSRGFKRGVTVTQEGELVNLFINAGLAMGVPIGEADDVLKDMGCDEDWIRRSRMTVKLKFLSDRGYYSESFLASKFRKSSTFRKLLTASEQARDFRTIPFSVRYTRLSEAIAELNLPEGNVERALEFVENFNTDRKISIYLERCRVVNLKALDEAVGIFSSNSIDVLPEWSNGYQATLMMDGTDMVAWSSPPPGGNKFSMEGRTKYVICHKGDLAQWYEEWLWSFDDNAEDADGNLFSPVSEALALEPDLSLPLANWVVRS